MGMIQNAVNGVMNSAVDAKRGIEQSAEIKQQQKQRALENNLRVAENKAEGEALENRITENESKELKLTGQDEKLGGDIISKIQDMRNLEGEKPRKGRSKATIAQDMNKAKMDLEKMQFAKNQVQEQIMLTQHQGQEFRDRLNIVEARSKVLGGEK